jgi:predicted PurR-regulated permease PerM
MNPFLSPGGNPPSRRGGPPPVVTARIEIPFRTIIRLLLTLAALWFLIKIGAVLAQIFGGLVVAAALYPPILALRRRGFGRGRALATVIGGFLAILTIVLVFVIPPVVNESQELVDDVPTYIDEGMGWLRDNQRWLFDQILTWGEDIANAENVISEEPSNEEATTDTTGSFDSGSPEEEIAVEAEVGADEAIDAASRVGGFIGSAAIVSVLAIYFLIEGERTFGWLTRDLPPPLTNRLRRAFPALAEIIHSYILRQGLTSLICTVFTFVVLWAFGVPAALILAILAGVADAVPFIGVAVATVPAAVVALTQGPGTALAVTLLLLAYQIFEVVFIIPRIFRRTLQLSSFGMLFAVLIGWRLLGFGGMLLALPIAAALLRIEQVWLSDEENEEEPDGPSPRR